MEGRSKPFSKWLYQKLYDFWYWYALKVLGVPFIMVYNPPPEHNLLGITFSWTQGYVERIKANFALEAKVVELEKKIAELEAERDKAGNNEGDSL